MTGPRLGITAAEVRERLEKIVARSGVAPKYMTIDNMVELLGMPRRTMYRYMGDGSLQTRKVGRRVLIDVNAALVWLDEIEETANV